MTPTTHTYSVRGLTLAAHRFEVAGEGERALPLLCCHGFNDHGLSFAPMIGALRRPRTVIALDFRGHGHSGWVGAGGNYHFYDYFDDVHAALEHFELSRFELLGHSMGGSIAFGVAAIHPEKVARLMLLEGLGPPFSPPDDGPDRLRRWSEQLRRAEFTGDPEARRRQRKPMAGGLAEAAERLRRANPRLSVEVADALAVTFTEPASEGSGLVWRFDPLHRATSAKPFLEVEARALWSRLTMPVLSLLGAESPWVPEDLQLREAAIPGLISASVLGAGHNLHHDRPAVMAATVDWWTAGAEGPRPAGLA